jgi:signal peptidase II
MDEPANRPETDPVPTPAPLDRSPGRRHLIAFLVVAFLVTLDLWSKAEVMPWLEARMPEFPVYDAAAEPPLERDPHGHLRHPIAGNWLAFMHGLNHGAAFGRFGEFTGALVVARILASILLTFLILRAPRGHGWNLTSMVLILAGALGNLYDNLFYEPTIATGRRWGPVRDFIDVYFERWDYHFATFNVADSCITVGAVLLLLTGVFGKSDEPAAG